MLAHRVAWVVAFLFLAGCISPTAPPAKEPEPRDEGLYKSTFANPAPAKATKLQFVANVALMDDERFAGSGNFVQGDFVYGSAQKKGFFIASLKDPAHPVIIANASDETKGGRKAEVVTHFDGRLTLVVANGGTTVQTWDVTDPSHPVFGATFKVDRNHYVAQVPGTEVFVSTPSNGKGGTNTFVNVHDPATPKKLGLFGDHGCHGVTFLGRLGDAKFRGYCAGIERTEIWDMTGFDPNSTVAGLGIKLLGVVEENPLIGLGGAGLHHLATANEQGTVLIIGDEFEGGGGPGGCFASTPAASTPVGALWFYDVTDEMKPVLKGWISPPTSVGRAPGDAPSGQGDVLTGCTAHFGTIIPGEQKIVIAWYQAGVLLIDFTDPTRPVILDQYQGEGCNTWSARYLNGYVVTGDLGRGMDVLRLA